MNRWLNQIEKYLVLVLVFLFPAQLALHFWPAWSFVFGIRVDYLSPAIYLTDILVFMILALWLIRDSRSVDLLINKNKILLFLLSILIITNSIFSISTFETIYRWLKFLEFGSLAVYFANTIKTKDWKMIYITLFLSLILFSLIGIDQFLIGHTIGGPLYLLGERSFSISTPGIALSNVFGRNILRAYSTFSHPNALAGYLGVSVLLLFVVNFFNSSFKKAFGLVVISICFLLTFSLTSILSFIIVSILYLLKSKKLLQKAGYCFLVLSVFASLLMPIISERILSGVNLSKNILERLNLSIVSGKIISEHFWLGTGLNTFTIAMTKVKPLITSSWLLQPVHNIFLLSLSEVGIFGLLLLVLFFYKSVKIFPLIFIFIFITGFFDHYWLDSQQNLLLLALISARMTTWKS